MDSSLEPTPAKKRCVLINGSKMRPLKTIRQFRLPQQFPSTVKDLKSINVVESVASTITLPNTARVSPNVENRVPYKLQKLRILSPNGRDLGEFNVNLQSVDSSKGNAITITKSNCKSSDKPLTLPLSPVLLSPVVSTKSFPRILKHASKIPRRNLTEMMSCNRSILRTDNSSVSHQQQSTTPNEKFSNSQNSQKIEGKVEKHMHNNSINADETHSKCEINSKRSICQTVNNNQKYIVYYGIDDPDIHKKIQEITANNKVSSASEISLSKEIIELPCSANSKRLLINSSDKNNIPSRNLKVSKGKCIATIKNTENGKIVTSLKSAANLMQKCNQTDRNLNKNNRNNRKSFINDNVSCNRNNSLETKSNIVFKVIPEKTQNVMTIIPNNNATSLNQNVALTQEYNIPLASSNIKNITNITDHNKIRHIIKYDNTQSESSKARSQNDNVVIDDHVRQIPESRITGVDVKVQSNVQSKDCPKDLPEKNLSDQLNIIKRAMDSIKDNELRELALKALADCGIGIERHVPIRPPEDHKAVHDTQVQTIVFGLLDPKSFILINKDLDDIHRLNQITLYDMPDNENLLAGNPHSNNSVFKDHNVIGRESPFDLDDFMEQFLKENSDVLKMKETLSTTKLRCNNLLKHLQRDFECVNRYDQNGMLNIHNAVVSDNIYLVQRQLMILQYCKQSIDVLTEDGVTSLELAIKYDVCLEIVKLLLDAGAQPVIPTSIHESAVIIASKRSSPLLSMLVSRISDSKLLDQVDSEGLAALHYCSMHGNLQGVEVLLSAGATIDLKDMKSGRTPLFHAIDNGHVLVKKVLLKAGALTSIANYAGQTPLSVISDPKKIYLSDYH